MQKTIEKTTIRLVQGDITAQDVDAVVNAANSSLMGGGGVDGAIHRKGGPAILEECKAIIADIGRLETGGAVITTGGNLPADHVIHTVGPRYTDGNHGENVALENAYLNSLEQAKSEGLRTIAFPSISTGAYRFPIEEAALIALNTIVRFVRENPDALDEVRMVLFGADDYATYEARFAEVVETMLG
jgi:O-acetyl-ADP-ribose deacetylase (regulator of RNase III)